MEKLKKSFTDQNFPPKNNEEKQILLHPTDTVTPISTSTSSSASASNPINGNNSSDRKDVSIKITDPFGNDHTEVTQQLPVDPIWRRPSYDFSLDAARGIRDFGFDTDSPSPENTPLSKIPESPGTTYGGVLTPLDKEGIRVYLNETVHRRSNASNNSGGRRSRWNSGEVLLCTGNASFNRKSRLLRMKTKSRLLDPPEVDQRSQTFLMKSEMDDDNETCWDDDLPSEYKRMTLGKWTLLEIVILILLIGALVCSLSINSLKDKKLFELEYWKWLLTVLVLICGRLVSGWGIRVVVFFVEKNFVLRKRVLYFVYGLRKAVQNCIWLSMVLIAWLYIFDKRVERITNGKVLPYVTKIWICLLVGTLVWLLKTLLVQVLASSFHVSTFFDRIQESLFNQYAIETLSGQPSIEILREIEEEDSVIAEIQKLESAGATLPPDLKANIFRPKSRRVIATPWKKSTSAVGRSPRISHTMSKSYDEGITIDHLHRLNQKNISAWNMTRLMNIIRKGVLATLDEKVQDSGGEGESSVQITSEIQAKAAAKKIFNNVANPGSKHIYLEDVMRFMKEDEALKTVRLLEGEGATESNGISKRALKNWVVTAFRERRALALSLNDTKTAVNKLHQMLTVVVGIIIVVIWLLILKVASTQFFIFLSSQFLLVVFVFGNTCKTTFEAIIFLFVMHPFDVGDRCEIDGV